MRKILILGAGKSSISLIDYLVTHAPSENWTITVADLTAQLALSKTKNRAHTQAIAIDLKDDNTRKTLIAAHDIVISMLPAVLHTVIAHDCLELNRNLVTPSYISPAMQDMAEAVKAKGLIFMNEMGLDPGIDHMSAMQLLDHLKESGKKITSFRSHCGGLVALESDTNSWHYKFSWNPRNVILAGQGDGGIRWRESSTLKEITYQQLFQHTSTIDLHEQGLYESYPNRDSLKYITEYGLEDIETIYRGTLRVPPYCEAWDCIVQLGLTNINQAYQFRNQKEALDFLQINHKPPIIAMLNDIGLFEENNFSPTLSAAECLQKILEEKWKMQATDRDLVVMVHEIEYLENGIKRNIQSSLHLKGTDGEHTAMALTVGLPLAIVTKLILNKQVSLCGVLLPKHPAIYNPVMKELEQYQIKFKERYH